MSFKVSEFNPLTLRASFYTPCPRMLHGILKNVLLNQIFFQKYFEIKINQPPSPPTAPSVHAWLFQNQFLVCKMHTSGYLTTLRRINIVRHTQFNLYFQEKQQHSEIVGSDQEALLFFPINGDTKLWENLNLILMNWEIHRSRSRFTKVDNFDKRR